MEKIVKSDAEWRAELPADRYHVLREAGTERPFTGALLQNKGTGVYTCAACGNELFDSDTKYESGSGWPSFYDARPRRRRAHRGPQPRHGPHRGALRPLRVAPRPRLRRRPAPDGERYCMNSLSLDFAPRG
jgi:peptide-methionine (R)-S-oxide reductase